MSNIVLVGFMGTGKTAVAKLLAEKTGMIYLSTDAMIEERENMPISGIFREKGEKYFRQKEKEVIAEAADGDNQVIDAGGGVVINDDNMEVLRRNGIIVCLWASEDVIYERIRHYTHRPLLNVKDPVLKIKELLAERRALYEKADHHIDTTDLSIEETVEAVKNVEKKEDSPQEGRR
jgi:shikimate kinase